MNPNALIDLSEASDRTPIHALTAPLLMLLLACAPTSPPELLLEPDPQRAGLDGSFGPNGVGFSTFRAARATGQSFDVDLHFPATEDAEMVDGAHPMVVVIQGGAVAHERYLWMGEHLASRGYIALTPAYPLDLAIFGGNRTHEAIDRARHLAENGPSRGRDVKDATGIARATAMMRSNHYGWFEKQGKGVYALSTAGRKALNC